MTWHGGEMPGNHWRRCGIGAVQIMNFVLQMMNFVLQMTDFALNMLNCGEMIGAGVGETERAQATREPRIR